MDTHSFDDGRTAFEINLLVQAVPSKRANGIVVVGVVVVQRAVGVDIADAAGTSARNHEKLRNLLFSEFTPIHQLTFNVINHRVPITY